MKRQFSITLDSDVDAFVQAQAQRERISVAAWINKTLATLVPTAQVSEKKPVKRPAKR